MKAYNPKLLIVDLFCGAGGTTTGFSQAQINGNDCAKIIACVNHDPIAIKSHWANHPEVKHFEEDIRTLPLGPLLELCEKMKKKYPDAMLVLWASLECTNFSKAKGGQPRDADSRTLAEHLFRYIDILPLDAIKIENVEEFMSWGPLDEKGKPVSRFEGRDFLKWVGKIRKRGYAYDYRLLNSADYGAHTSRTRYFGLFAKSHYPMVFPSATHAKKNKSGDLFGGQLAPWKPVKEVLDLDDHGRDIFERNKPLSEKTLQRIYAGLIKYVAGGKEAFILKYNSTSKKGVHQPPSLDDPCPVISTQNRLGIVNSQFLFRYFSGRPEGKVSSTAEPSPTVTTFGGGGCVFISTYHGNGHNCHSADSPAPAVVAADTLAKVHAQWLDKQYSGEANHQPLDVPAGSVLTKDKYGLTSAFLMNHQYGNEPKSIDQPAPTLLASRRHYYIINPSWGGNPGSVNEPCCTVVARQDKAPLYLTVTESGHAAIAVFDNDSETTIKIKEFMALYGIARITMRMLKVMELKMIQGFPKDYVLHGNQSDQKKFIGNAVVPIIPQRWAEAVVIYLNEKKKAA